MIQPEPRHEASEFDPTTDNAGVSPEVLDVMNRVLLETAQPRLSLHPIREGENGDNSVALRPVWVVEAGSQPESSLGQLSPDTIIDTVEDYFGLERDEVRGHARTRSKVKARHIAMYLAYELTGKSYPYLAEFFGGRDHTTVINGVNKVNEKLREKSLGTTKAVEELKTILKDPRFRGVDNENGPPMVDRTVVLLTSNGLHLATTFELNPEDRALFVDDPGRHNEKYRFGFKWVTPITNPDAWRAYAQLAFDQLRTLQK